MTFLDNYQLYLIFQLTQMYTS